jgi:hypothetical protein
MGTVYDRHRTNIASKISTIKPLVPIYSSQYYTHKQNHILANKQNQQTKKTAPTFDRLSPSPHPQHLRAFPTKTTRKLHILRLNSHPLAVNSTQIRVLEKRDKVRLNSLLQRADRTGLEPQVGLEVLGDFTHQALEGQFTDKEFSRLLVPTDFSQGDSTGTVTMGFLDSAGGLPLEGRLVQDVREQTCAQPCWRVVSAELCLRSIFVRFATWSVWSTDTEMQTYLSTSHLD